jgi:dTDP-4-amino-4,6-dideoxygalactose transaminase
MSTLELSGRPALHGGRPLFPEGMPLARPTVSNPERVAQEILQILHSGHLTNGPYVRELERVVTERVGVRHAVAVSSCTAGLMLLLRAADLTGDVVVPSFTFMATAHAVAWNGLHPRFADIDRHTLTLSAGAAMGAIGMRASAILATHTYGTPCDVEALEESARQSGIRLFFDAAHAFGSTHRGKPVGRFGDAEVFSLTPTKPVIAGEGGIIMTNDDELAERCRLGRDYGKTDDYDVRFIGLNGRMSELHAAVALASLDGVDERIEERNSLADRYRAALGTVPGVSFPQVRVGDRSTYKDFTVLIDSDVFGLDAASLARALAAEGIETRRYYSPPVHRTRAYRTMANGPLPVTEWAADRVLTLPLWGGMNDDHIERVAEAIRRIRRFLPTDGVG